MAERKIVWTKKANSERQEILNFWIERNTSKRYSIKLNKLFVESLQRLANNPQIGRKTNFEGVRVKRVRDYLIFYQFDNNSLKVLCVWDSRRDVAKLHIK